MDCQAAEDEKDVAVPAGGLRVARFKKENRHGHYQKTGKHCGKRARPFPAAVRKVERQSRHEEGEGSVHRLAQHGAAVQPAGHRSIRLGTALLAGGEALFTQAAPPDGIEKFHGV